MNMMEFRKIVKSDYSAMRYIEKVCDRKGPAKCPRCVESPSVYRVENGKRRRCGSCGHTFTVVSGRWISKVKIPFTKWLWIVKLYEMEMTARKISEEIDISYPTVLKAVNTIRSSILAVTNHGREFFCGDEDCCLPSICSSSGVKGSDSEMKPVSREDILSVRELGGGCIIYTKDSFRGDCITCGGVKHYRVESRAGEGGCGIFLAGNKGRWSFIKERLAKFHGIRSDLLPIYMTVIDYHFENRGNDMFELLMDNLCSFILPDQDEPFDSLDYDRYTQDCVEIS